MSPLQLPEEVLRIALPYSQFAQRLLDSETDLRPALLEHLQQPYLKKEMQMFLQSSIDDTFDESALHQALRKLRKHVFLRLAIRDLAGLADLPEVMNSMTDLAEVTINFALKHHQDWLASPARFGFPIGKETGATQHMLVVAMGKLGGRELNVSSDVDLIFVYPEDGETNGTKSISNQAFFARLGQKLIASLNDYTIDSYVFRVDMRLRPYGENSPLVISFSMLEEYFLTQGREWERYAWIKSRVIAGPSKNESTLMEQIVRPFVFRKYLDFGAYESMRRLHAQLRKEVERREMYGNIKLGPGGIREIEFITQVFQLIRGGRDIDLCIRPTLTALQRLQDKQLLPAHVVTELIEAYCFLRKLEHRLQYFDDQQTQTLPRNLTEQTLMSAAMGFPSHEKFEQQLDIHRMNVTHHFDLILAEPKKSPTHDILANLWQTPSEDTTETKKATTQLSTMGFANPVEVSQRLQQFYNSSSYHELNKSNQRKICALIPTLIEITSKYPPVEITLTRMLGLLDKISQHTPYLSLLQEHPHTLERVAKLTSISQWASDYLGRHPILLDELLRDDAKRTTPDWHTIKQQLINQLNHVNNPKSDVIEWQMDHLRHFQHAQVFQLLVNDLEGSLLSLETLSDHLTALADLVLDAVLNLAWAGLKKKHCDTPAFAIIGYGKLGGKELSYSSDLDLVFLYDDSHPDAPETYTKLAQSINSWLTRHTSTGLLYETDLRLRPNGADGLLVCTTEAFTQYQREQAWVWEHQALTRARFIAGDPHVAEIFDKTRKVILCQQRNTVELKQDILSMRLKMLNAHPKPATSLDIKHDRGGIIDVEFIVQYLILSHACKYPELTGNIGNIALLKLAGELGLIHIDSAKKVRAAYRAFRRTQHRLSLSSNPELISTSSTEEPLQKLTRSEIDALNSANSAVRQLWSEVFDA